MAVGAPLQVRAHLALKLDSTGYAATIEAVNMYTQSRSNLSPVRSPAAELRGVESRFSWELSPYALKPAAQSRLLAIPIS